MVLTTSVEVASIEVSSVQAVPSQLTRLLAAHNRQSSCHRRSPSACTTRAARSITGAASCEAPSYVPMPELRAHAHACAHAHAHARATCPCPCPCPCPCLCPSYVPMPEHMHMHMRPYEAPYDLETHKLTTCMCMYAFVCMHACACVCAPICQQYRGRVA